MLADQAAWERDLGEAVARAEASGVSVAVEVRRPDAVRFGHRCDEPVRATGPIRLGVLAELFRQADAGRVSLDAVHPVGAEDKAGGVGVLAHLHEGLQTTLGDLAALMTIASDDRAAEVLLAQLGTDAVHTGLRRMGLTHTLLGGPPGDAAPDATTTAQELVALLVALVEGTATTQPSARRMTDLLRASAGRRAAARHLPAEVGRGGKDGAGGGVVADVLFADLPEGRVYLAVLLDGVTDEIEGERIVAELARVACGV